MDPQVIARDERGRVLLWQCSECGKPFGRPPYPLGWGSLCNPCITAAKRHEELIAALERNQ